MELSKDEKRVLLHAARQSVETIFTDEELPLCDYEKYPSLKKEAGAFVTLTENGMLRGCIGYVTSNKPLYETVCEAAIHAAQNDPRFEPLRRSELPLINIEISVLSEPFPIENYDEIVIGKHGLIVEEKGSRGLLLPQVPLEYNLSKEQYLEALCQKAGLPADYWKVKQLKLYAFTANVFSEAELEAI